jgi:hypothetical protein
MSAAARVGDIHHCTADNAAVSAAFGCRPTVELAAGLAKLAAADCKPAACAPGAAADLTVARRELAQAGLLR